MNFFDNGYNIFESLNARKDEVVPFMSISFSPQHLLIAMGIVVAFLQTVFFAYYSRFRMLEKNSKDSASIIYFPRLLSPEDPITAIRNTFSEEIINRAVWFSFLFTPILLLSIGATMRFHLGHLTFKYGYFSALGGGLHEFSQPAFLVDLINIFALYLVLSIASKILSNDIERSGSLLSNLFQPIHLVAIIVLGLMVIPIIGALTDNFGTIDYFPNFFSVRLWLYTAYVFVWTLFVMKRQNGMQTSAISIFCVLINIPIIVVAHF